jgi:hypothetical protein
VKLLVEPTGEFQLHQPGDELFARHNRPSVVRNAFFIQQHIAAGRLKVINQVADSATDVELVEYLKDAKDESLAVAAFVAAHPADGVVEGTAAPTPRAKARAK